MDSLPDDLHSLRAAWHAAPAAPLPSAREVAAQARRGRRKLVLTNAGLLAWLAATMAFIGWGFQAWEFRFQTTYYGMLLVLLAVGAAVVVGAGLLRLLLGPTDSATDSRAYLTQLRRYRARQRYLQTVGMQVYYILLAAGLALYLYEFAARNWVFGVVVYGLTFGWVTIAWIWLRPRAIRRQNAALDALIEHTEALAAQLEAGNA